MKKRKIILLILTLCFLTQTQVFAGEQTVDTSKTKNIILLVGNGMGLSHLYADIIANKGETNFSRFSAMGLSKTYSASDFTTETAAAATALATGVKTHNGAVGVDKNNDSVPNIREIAQTNGLATGIVVTSPLAYPLPGAFIAHLSDKNKKKEIANAYVNSGIDVFIGGQGNWFYNPKENINLVPGLRKHQYQICIYPAELNGIKKGKLAASISQSWAKKRGDLGEVAAQKAIELLNQNSKGFFLMVGASKIAKASKEGKFDRVVAEVQDFDRVVGKALDFAKKDGHTLVIVTATDEAGGLVLTDGNRKTGAISGKFTSDHPTPVMVPVFAYGPGADTFTGIYENTAVFEKMIEAYNFKK